MFTFLYECIGYSIAIYYYILLRTFQPITMNTMSPDVGMSTLIDTSGLDMMALPFFAHMIHDLELVERISWARLANLVCEPWN